jgi:hypothetical protein
MDIIPNVFKLEEPDSYYCFHFNVFREKNWLRIHALRQFRGKGKDIHCYLFFRGLYYISLPTHWEGANFTQRPLSAFAHLLRYSSPFMRDTDEGFLARESTCHVYTLDHLSLQGYVVAAGIDFRPEVPFNQPPPEI